MEDLKRTGCRDIRRRTRTTHHYFVIALTLFVLSNEEKVSRFGAHSFVISLQKRSNRRNRSSILGSASSSRDQLAFTQTIDGPFTVESFASTHCWGRRPLLIKSAFDAKTILTDGEDSLWPTWEEMIEIACDEDAESRLILHQPRDWESFIMELGPFSKEELDDLVVGGSGNKDDEKWSLVVNDVDRFYPPLSDWINDIFSFLPRWRRDDGQVSLAHAGGGIGPHVDNYDVFLIQMSGKRIWEVGSGLTSVEEEMESLVEGIDVRILQEWEGKETSRGGNYSGVDIFELSPGDVLYLPPRVAHCGTALSNDCMTLSIGCRAPAASEMISCLAERVSETLTGHAVRRYEDPNLLEAFVDKVPPFVDNEFRGHTGELTNEAKNQMKQLAMNAMNEMMDDDHLWDEMVGKIVTEAKRARMNYPMALTEADGTPVDKEWIDSLGVWGEPSLAVSTMISGTGALYQAEGLSFSFSSVSTNNTAKTCHRLFVNGEMFEVEADADLNNQTIVRFLSRIVSLRKLTKEELLESDEIPSKITELLELLVAKGLLYGSDE